MKKLFILLTTLLTNAVFAQLTYVDNFDGVYPLPPYNNQSTSLMQNFDLNNDGKVNLADAKEAVKQTVAKAKTATAKAKKKK